MKAYHTLGLNILQLLGPSVQWHCQDPKDGHNHFVGGNLKSSTTVVLEANREDQQMKGAQVYCVGGNLRSSGLLHRR